jgi:Transposase IS66 family
LCPLFNLWEIEPLCISRKPEFAQGMRYAMSRRRVLECFLIDGRVEINSNIVVRAIRPQTITRKIVLFTGRDRRSETSPTADSQNERRWRRSSVCCPIWWHLRPFCSSHRELITKYPGAVDVTTFSLLRHTRLAFMAARPSHSPSWCRRRKTGLT